MQRMGLDQGYADFDTRVCDISVVGMERLTTGVNLAVDGGGQGIRLRPAE